MAEFPEVRIGTAERERALEDLSHHFSAGRLSMVEFDERSAAIAAATTRRELTAVFADLPTLAPEAAEPPKNPAGSWDWRAAAIAVAPILAVALFFIFHQWLFFLLIPAVPAVLGAAKRVLPGEPQQREID